jgi:hypothetical protein
LTKLQTKLKILAGGQPRLTALHFVVPHCRIAKPLCVMS